MITIGINKYNRKDVSCFSELSFASWESEVPEPPPPPPLPPPPPPFPPGLLLILLILFLLLLSHIFIFIITNIPFTIFGLR
jgi:hypothetical protein